MAKHAEGKEEQNISWGVSSSKDPFFWWWRDFVSFSSRSSSCPPFFAQNIISHVSQLSYDFEKKKRAEIGNRHHHYHAHHAVAIIKRAVFSEGLRGRSFSSCKMFVRKHITAKCVESKCFRYRNALQASCQPEMARHQHITRWLSRSRMFLFCSEATRSSWREKIVEKQSTFLYRQSLISEKNLLFVYNKRKTM